MTDIIDNRTKTAGVAFVAIMALIPVSVIIAGSYVASGGIDELETLLAAYPGLADAIVRVSGGLAMVLFGCVAALFYLIILRSPDHADRIEERVEDPDDIED